MLICHLIKPVLTNGGIIYPVGTEVRLVEMSKSKQAGIIHIEGCEKDVILMDAEYAALTEAYYSSWATDGDKENDN